MIGKIVIGAALMTAVVMKDGLVDINVHEKKQDGSHVHFFVPATAATWGVHLAPERRLAEHLRGKKDQLEIARVAISELERIPDTIIVQVDSPREHVTVATRNGSFVIDADTPEETVHLRLPIRAARKVIEDLEANSPST